MPSNLFDLYIHFTKRKKEKKKFVWLMRMYLFVGLFFNFYNVDFFDSTVYVGLSRWCLLVFIEIFSHIIFFILWIHPQRTAVSVFDRPELILTYYSFSEFLYFFNLFFSSLLLFRFVHSHKPIIYLFKNSLLYHDCIVIFFFVNSVDFILGVSFFFVVG